MTASCHTGYRPRRAAIRFSLLGGPYVSAKSLSLAASPIPLTRLKSRKYWEGAMKFRLATAIGVGVLVAAFVVPAGTASA
jgi:hypothetical protein